MSLLIYGKTTCVLCDNLIERGQDIIHPSRSVSEETIDEAVKLIPKGIPLNVDVEGEIKELRAMVPVLYASALRQRDGVRIPDYLNEDLYDSQEEWCIAWAEWEKPWREEAEKAVEEYWNKEENSRKYTPEYIKTNTFRDSSIHKSCYENSPFREVIDKLGYGCPSTCVVDSESTENLPNDD